MNPYRQTKINGFKMFIGCCCLIILSNSASSRVALGVLLSIFIMRVTYLKCQILMLFFPLFYGFISVNPDLIVNGKRK